MEYNHPLLVEPQQLQEGGLLLRLVQEVRERTHEVLDEVFGHGLPAVGVRPLFTGLYGLAALGLQGAVGGCFDLLGGVFLIVGHHERVLAAALDLLLLENKLAAAQFVQNNDRIVFVLIAFPIHLFILMKLRINYIFFRDIDPITTLFTHNLLFAETTVQTLSINHHNAVRQKLKIQMFENKICVIRLYVWLEINIIEFRLGLIKSKMQMQNLTHLSTIPCIFYNQLFRPSHPSPFIICQFRRIPYCLSDCPINPNYKMITKRIILLSYLPFILFDLYYSLTQTSCCHQPIMNTNIKFDLSKWLFVKGLTQLIVVMFPVLVYVFERWCNTLPLWYASYLILYSFFELAWLIVGTIMFVGYLAPNRYCKRRFNLFMWFDIICGYIRLFCLTCLERNQDLQPMILKKLRWVRRDH